VADLLYVCSAGRLVAGAGDLRAWLSGCWPARCGPARRRRRRCRRAGCSGWAWSLLLAASCGLEWTRLYRWESALPGHAGGVLGHALGPASMRWLGFAGSGVTWIACWWSAWPGLRFSWARVADAIGERVDGLLERRQVRKEQEQDRRIGEQALREREHVVELKLERQIEDVHAPLVIERRCSTCRAPSAWPRAPEAAVQELTDTKLPQVDLLDAAPGSQEDS
jgi:S-DNA-T family DNA segregation ATPase FtsK/SpoIIIE